MTITLTLSQKNKNPSFKVILSTFYKIIYCTD